MTNNNQQRLHKQINELSNLVENIKNYEVDLWANIHAPKTLNEKIYNIQIEIAQGYKILNQISVVEKDSYSLHDISKKLDVLSGIISDQLKKLDSIIKLLENTERKGEKIDPKSLQSEIEQILKADHGGNWESQSSKIIKQMISQLESLINTEFCDKTTGIDFFPYDTKERSQLSWMKFLGDKNKRMISVADLYHACKVHERSDPLILSLIGMRVIITGTQMIYNKNSSSAKIIHSDGTNKEVVMEDYITAYNGHHGFDKLPNTENSLNFLRALFGTNDDESTMTQVLSKLSEGYILSIEYPLQNERHNHMRAVRLSRGTAMLGPGTFSINCDADAESENVYYGAGNSLGIRK